MRITLFDQETAEKNFIASAIKETTLNVNLAAIKNLMETTRWSAVEAMNAMKIPVDQQSIYAAQL